MLLHQPYRITRSSRCDRRSSVPTRYGRSQHSSTLMACFRLWRFLWWFELICACTFHCYHNTMQTLVDKHAPFTATTTPCRLLSISMHLSLLSSIVLIWPHLGTITRDIPWRRTQENSNLFIAATSLTKIALLGANNRVHFGSHFVEGTSTALPCYGRRKQAPGRQFWDKRDNTRTLSSLTLINE